MSWSQDGVDVRAVGGGLWIVQEGYGILLDAPVNVSLLLESRELATLGTVALSGGRIGSVGGLVPLLCALEPHRVPDIPLNLVEPLGDERGSQLASAWTQGWPGRYLIAMDTLAPGQSFDAGPFAIDTVSIVRGEPRWRPEPGVMRVSAMAFRVHTAAGIIAFIPGSAPRGIQRAILGSRLAVIEAGTEGWPTDERRWRIGVSEAGQLKAHELWVLDERGAVPRGAEA